MRVFIETGNRHFWVRTPKVDYQDVSIKICSARGIDTRDSGW